MLTLLSICFDIWLTCCRKYKDGLFRIILREDGEKVIPQSIPAIPLVGDNTLSVTQAPDGTLIDTRYQTSQVFVHTPTLTTTSPDLQFFGVFPRRGSDAGGYILSIYGKNFNKGTPSVTVGTLKCPIISIQPKQIKCRVSGGKGNVDVQVVIRSEKVTLTDGFRYIKGRP